MYPLVLLKQDDGAGELSFFNHLTFTLARRWIANLEIFNGASIPHKTGSKLTLQLFHFR